MDGLGATRAGDGLTAAAGTGLVAGLAATLGAGLIALAVGGAAGEVLADGVDVLADGTAGAHPISTTVSNAKPSAVRGGLVIIVQTRVSVYPSCLESRSRPARLRAGNVRSRGDGLGGDR